MYSQNFCALEEKSCDDRTDEKLLKEIGWKDRNLKDIDNNGDVEIVYGLFRLSSVPVESWCIVSRDKEGNLCLCKAETDDVSSSDLCDINNDGKEELVIKEKMGSIDLSLYEYVGSFPPPHAYRKNVCEFSEGKLIVSNKKFSDYLLQDYKDQKDQKGEYLLYEIKESEEIIKEEREELKYVESRLSSHESERDKAFSSFLYDYGEGLRISRRLDEKRQAELREKIKKDIKDFGKRKKQYKEIIKGLDKEIEKITRERN